MLNIEKIETMDDFISNFIDKGFNYYAAENNLICNYTPFCFAAKDNGEVIGVLTGHSYYDEIHISNLIVSQDYRNKHIGGQLPEHCTAYFTDKGFANINLTTYAFQAPLFYEKQGFQLEFVRENKVNPKLTKYFYVKYY